MPLLDNQTLTTQATCVDCGVPQGMQLAILIVLFADLAKVSADPQSLVTAASCVQCAIPPGMQMSVLISLANQILAGGGGGGGGGATCLFCGVGAPVAASTCSCALYVDTASGDFWYWNSTTTQTWVELIGG
jgi:hypothetical protein